MQGQRKFKKGRGHAASCCPKSQFRGGTSLKGTARSAVYASRSGPIGCDSHVESALLRPLFLHGGQATSQPTVLKSTMLAGQPGHSPQPLC